MWRMRVCAFVCAALVLFSAPPAYASDSLSVDEAETIIERQNRTERALLIGVDRFVSKPDTYPVSTNNVYAIQEMLQGAISPLERIIVPSEPVASVSELTALIQETFGDAEEGDVSYLYLSTHGVYEDGGEPMLLLSDGTVEEGVTPAQLESAFEGISGTKMLILDACNSGAFIGKGMASQPEELYFQGEDFKVLTSSGAMEESWYWSMEDGEDSARGGEVRQGSFYFTQALSQSLSAHGGYPADLNRDGSVTLTELYDYLLLNHAASTPQVYPQTDDFVVFSYDVNAELPTGMERSPVMDITFSGTMLSQSSRQITIEFIATRPVRVAYQIVYQHDGKWQFDKAQLIYDQAELFTAFGDQAGAVSAGRKVRSLTIGELPDESYGYVLVQLLTIDQGKLAVQAGRVLCVPPSTGDVELTASVSGVFSPGGGREMSIFIGHNYPCALSVAIVDEEEQVVYRLCHRRSTRPMQMEPTGSVFYWDGRLKDGTYAEPGDYRVRAQATINDTTVTVFSSVFTVQ